MSEAPQFSVDRDTSGALHLRGEISYLNAARALREAPQHLSGESATDLDLRGLRHADSATLAVLIAWSARARRHGARLNYTHAPPGLRNLARLCDVEQLLGLN